MARERVETIDYLRGILSVSIMFYHYIRWYFPKYLGPDDLLSKVGVFGISAFFIISGMSMCLAYNGRLDSAAGVNQYVLRRALRIIPLYILASATALLLASIETTSSVVDVWGWRSIVLNFSLLFAFVDPSKAVPVGGWSIGNELFFYCYFPVALFLIRLNRAWAISVIALATSIFLYWTLFLLPVTGGANFWKDYVSNQSQGLYFIVGIIIAYLSKSYRLGTVPSIGLGAVSFVAFYYYPVASKTDLMLGWDRVFLSVCTIVFVACIYYIHVKVPKALTWLLTTIGALSFSIYMVHPLAFTFVRLLPFTYGWTPQQIITAAVCCTLVVSYIVYHWFELPIMRLGKKPKPRAPITAEPVKA